MQGIASKFSPDPDHTSMTSFIMLYRFRLWVQGGRFSQIRSQMLHFMSAVLGVQVLHDMPQMADLFVTVLIDLN